MESLFVCLDRLMVTNLSKFVGAYEDTCLRACVLYMQVRVDA